uniref:Uncharacterized protein n=1 Tax=Aegilops tauschii subsp. strangulata TaxID=200361 RepID=A0A453PD54_AEGTS
SPSLHCFIISPGVQRSEQRGRVPDQLDHGADGRPERRRGVLQAHVAVRGEPEPVHAGQAAGEADVPAAAAVGGPGPVGRPVQGGKDPRVLRQLHRRQPAGRPLPARRGAGAVQRGAAPVARVAGGGGRRPAGRAQPPGRVILVPVPQSDRGRSSEEDRVLTGPAEDREDVYPVLAYKWHLACSNTCYVDRNRVN